MDLAPEYIPAPDNGKVAQLNGRMTEARVYDADDLLLNGSIQAISTALIATGDRDLRFDSAERNDITDRAEMMRIVIFPDGVGVLRLSVKVDAGEPFNRKYRVAASSLGGAMPNLQVWNRKDGKDIYTETDKRDRRIITRALEVAMNNSTEEGKKMLNLANALEESVDRGVDNQHKESRAARAISRLKGVISR